MSSLAEQHRRINIQIPISHPSQELVLSVKFDFLYMHAYLVSPGTSYHRIKGRIYDVHVLAESFYFTAGEFSNLEGGEGASFGGVLGFEPDTEGAFDDFLHEPPTPVTRGVARAEEI